MIDYEIENAIIGCLLVSPDEMKNYYNVIQPKMFQSSFCRKVYEALFLFFEKGEDVDVNLLSSKLSENNPKVDWGNRLREMLMATPTSVGIKGYVKTLVNEYRAREFTEFLANQTINPSCIDDVMAATQTFIESLKENRQSNNVSAKSLMAKMKNHCFVDRRDTERKITTDLFQLDDYLKIEPKEVTVIGARPSVGKSALALMIAQYVASGLKVDYFNLEMNEVHIGQRLIAMGSDLELARIVNAKAFLGDEKEKFNKALEVQSNKNLNIITDSLSDLDIVAECRYNKPDLVVIDYLQLIRCASKKVTNRREEVGAVSRRIKEMAMELNVPVILLSQLSRKSEYTSDKRPTMADLRETGDIEQDASNILLMWNLSDDKQYRSFKGLAIDKNRQGELFEECLVFDGNHMKFTESPKPLSEIKASIEKNEDIDVYEDMPF